MKKILVLIVSVLLVANAYAGNKKKNVSEVTFKVEMDCQSCVNKIKKNIPFEKGVRDLEVNFEAQTVKIKYRDDKTSKDKLIMVFEKMKFKAEELKEGECVKPQAKCCEGHHH